MTDIGWIFFIKELEGNFNTLYFFVNGIPPEVVVISIINFNGILISVGTSKPNFKIFL